MKCLILDKSGNQDQYIKGLIIAYGALFSYSVNVILHCIKECIYRVTQVNELVAYLSWTLVGCFLGFSQISIALDLLVKLVKIEKQMYLIWILQVLNSAIVFLISFFFGYPLHQYYLVIYIIIFVIVVFLQYKCYSF